MHDGHRCDLNRRLMIGVYTTHTHTLTHTPTHTNTQKDLPTVVSAPDDSKWNSTHLAVGCLVVGNPHGGATHVIQKQTYLLTQNGPATEKGGGGGLPFVFARGSALGGKLLLQIHHPRLLLFLRAPIHRERLLRTVDELNTTLSGKAFARAGRERWVARA